MKNWKWIVCGLAALGVPALVSAEAGVTDYTTYMYRTYSANQPLVNGQPRCASFTDTQWTNWDDWRDEMGDIASCFNCQQGSTTLNSRLTGGSRSTGLNADLMAIDTHGLETGSGSTHHGWLADFGCATDVDVNNIDPLDSEVEIYLMNVCNIYARNNTDNWFSFRNMHRFGAPVSAGCWDICFKFQSPVDTTWNDMGDEIADVESHIIDGWYVAHDWSATDEDIIVIGSGTVGAADCDNRADSISFQNRLNNEGPTYAKNRAQGFGSSDPELCGFFWTNL